MSLFKVCHVDYIGGLGNCGQCLPWTGQSGNTAKEAREVYSTATAHLCGWGLILNRAGCAK